MKIQNDKYESIISHMQPEINETSSTILGMTEEELAEMEADLMTETLNI